MTNKLDNVFSSINAIRPATLGNTRLEAMLADIELQADYIAVELESEAFSLIDDEQAKNWLLEEIIDLTERLSIVGTLAS